VGHLDVVSERSKWEDEGDPLRGRISLQQEDHDKVGRQHFEILKLIGKGSFGNVYKARFLKNGIIYALKQQSKQKLMKDKNLKYALGENKILRRTYCPFLINMHYAF
jgi:serine/threonine protein kinase